MPAEVLAAVVAAVLLAAIARRFGLSSPLMLVVAGLAMTLIPGLPTLVLDPEFVLYVILPPLLWTAGLESSYMDLRKNAATVGLLAVGLPLATTAVVGFVAYQTVPALPLAAALVLGAIVAPPDAVSATAIGRRLGLPRRLMSLLGGESLLNDATSLTAYKLALAAAIGMAESWGHAVGVFVWAVAGGVLVGVVMGKLILFVRARLNDPVAESAIGLVAPFVCYLIGEQVQASGVLAVVTASLMLGQRATDAGYATRLQDQAVWRSVQLILESVAFLLIGLQLPAVVRDLTGIPATVLLGSAVAVFAAVLVVRILWVFAFAYLTPSWLVPGGNRPPPSALFVVAWAGMRGVVSLAAAFAVPMTTLSGDEFPGRPYIVFLTFVVVIGTLLLHGLTLPWLVRTLGVRGDDARADALAIVAARTRAAESADRRLNELLADAREEGKPMAAYEAAARLLREWNNRRRSDAWKQPMESDEGQGPAPAAAYRRLRLEMIAAERESFIAERDANRIDDEVLRTLMHDLDLLEASLNG
ncbi:Na+/H+ antiporter [Mycolicibacterium insubricum]|uniref:Na+/H+ antiporter n=1 Tax=Mycolicibacterium insubricum TaxID=444597 RepID=UPI00138C69A5|nr:Na+/H+ antiporter [Mycolicibacterium insubricum]BBZ65567.1 Na+/H+ antiporter [Mycolicibacterium insubricum]